MKSKLLIANYDGKMHNLTIKPHSSETEVVFEISYYANGERGEISRARIHFMSVVAIDFQMNYFSSTPNLDLFGFYELFDQKKKSEMIDKIFSNRMDSYLYHGNYNYDKNDANDFLNQLTRIDTAKYHLYEQDLDGGIYFVLASSYKLTML